jgi:hypothetical protein
MPINVVVSIEASRRKFFQRDRLGNGGDIASTNALPDWPGFHDVSLTNDNTKVRTSQPESNALKYWQVPSWCALSSNINSVMNDDQLREWFQPVPNALPFSPYFDFGLSSDAIAVSTSRGRPIKLRYESPARLSSSDIDKAKHFARDASIALHDRHHRLAHIRLISVHITLARLRLELGQHIASLPSSSSSWPITLSSVLHAIDMAMRHEIGELSLAGIRASMTRSKWIMNGHTHFYNKLESFLPHANDDTITSSASKSLLTCIRRLDVSHKTELHGDSVSTTTDMLLPASLMALIFDYADDICSSVSLTITVARECLLLIHAAIATLVPDDYTSPFYLRLINTSTAAIAAAIPPDAIMSQTISLN